MVIDENKRRRELGDILGMLKTSAKKTFCTKPVCVSIGKQKTTVCVYKKPFQI